MPVPTEDQVAAALNTLLREALTQGVPVTVPGLGTFAVQHQSSRIEELPDGRVVMQPPRDEVVFRPAS